MKELKNYSYLKNIMMKKWVLLTTYLAKHFVDFIAKLLS